MRISNCSDSFMVVHPPPPPILTDLGCDILEFENGSTFYDIFSQQIGLSMSNWHQCDANFACDLVSPDQDDASLPKFIKAPGKIGHNLSTPTWDDQPRQRTLCESGVSVTAIIQSTWVGVPGHRS